MIYQQSTEPVLFHAADEGAAGEPEGTGGFRLVAAGRGEGTHQAFWIAATTSR